MTSFIVHIVIDISLTNATFHGLGPTGMDLGYRTTGLSDDTSEELSGKKRSPTAYPPPPFTPSPPTSISRATPITDTPPMTSPASAPSSFHGLPHAPPTHPFPDGDEPGRIFIQGQSEAQVEQAVRMRAL
eukprot:scaffold9726_cov119-Isochrysis_galbana.AAC.22